MTLRLRTFGALYLERDRTPLGGAHTQRRRLALLAYLAASDPPIVTRHKMIALLWPESDEAGGRHSLSQLVYSIRHDLGPDALSVDQETVGLNPEIITSDVRDFDLSIKAGQPDRAVEQYRGAFLDGFYVDDAPELSRWIDEERARHTALCARALEQLATHAEAARDGHAAADWWRRRTALDPADGRVTHRLMLALGAIGDRRGALQAARVYETLLRDELEAEPDGAVTRLAAELRRDTGQTSTGPVSHAMPTLAPAPMAAVHEPPPAPRLWRRGLVFASLALVLVVAAWQQVRGRASNHQLPLDGTRVVVGDLDGPDSVLALAVREALRAELSNTPGVLVTSDVSVREMRTLMRLPADSTLRPPHLLDIATRSGAYAAISGSVIPIGTGAQIVLDVLDPESGRPLQTFAERPVDAPAILKAVERIGRALGSVLSRAPRDSSHRALPAVTTASLPALKSFALARQLAARGQRKEAVEYAERAVAHDSAFVLAHYLLGDLLWFLDQQSHSDAHLTRAFELSGTAAPREQLIIRARYEQLARDRPESAMVYWGMLADASPHDVLAYEGRTWALRALGRHEEAAAAADTAMDLDPAAVVPNTNNAMYSWLAVGDTASALAVARRVADRNPEALPEARFHAALGRGDLVAALRLADSSAWISNRSNRRQIAHLARGDFAAARIALDSMRADDQAQVVPRAVMNQGWVELALRGDRAAARGYAREALAWLRRHDLSPPAVARIAERITDLAARSGDEATVRATIALIDQRDRGRSLRSYTMARSTMVAAAAYARGDFAVAATRAAEARHGVYFSRSLITIVQLEADARRAAGDPVAASALDRLVATHQIVDGDFETWAVLRSAVAARR